MGVGHTKGRVSGEECVGKVGLDSSGEVICKLEHDMIWEVKNFSVTGVCHETEQVWTDKAMLNGL